MGGLWFNYCGPSLLFSKTTIHLNGIVRDIAAQIHALCSVQADFTLSTLASTIAGQH